ncbi:hypothetical protein F4775DRAFT_218528 [Biscogniauxia sp. FL1348]|nr:hypothetical protein F4775DRAFT_218528 [Biscogniauxia sp. FL1348]
MGDTNYTASSKARPSRFLGADERLMTSGQFSDVEVKCGTRTWKLHRLILTPRCVWFNKALNSEFKEGKDGVVTIHEFEPDKIDLLIKYIYTSALPVGNSLDAGVFAKAIDLYELGDYFLLPELCEDSLDCLEGAFNQAARIMQEMAMRMNYNTIGFFVNYDEYGRPIRSHDTVKDDEQSAALALAFYDTVGKVYAHESLSEAMPLRDTIVSFYSKVDIYLQGYHKGGMEKLLKTPQFAADVLTKGHSVGMGMQNAAYPRSCYKCHTNPLSNTCGYFAKVWLDRINGNDNYCLRGFCQSCAQETP